MIYFLKWCISKNFLKYWNWQDEKTRQSCHSSRKEKNPNGIGKLMKQKRIGIEVSKLDRRF